ncbi:MAG: AAA family ATPase [Bacteroidia bacterium]
MRLNDLHLVNFRNYEEANLNFTQSVVVFTGNNGSGKTNLLDSIHYLAFCKSFLNPIDSQNIRLEEPFFVVQGTFESHSQNEAIYCGIKRGQKKVFKRNGKEYERLSEHIGRIPLVLFRRVILGLLLKEAKKGGDF